MRFVLVIVVLAISLLFGCFGLGTSPTNNGFGTSPTTGEIKSNQTTSNSLTNIGFGTSPTTGEIWSKQTTSNDLEIIDSQWTYYYADKGKCDMKIEIKSNVDRPDGSVQYYFESPYSDVASSYDAANNISNANAILDSGTYWIDRYSIPSDTNNFVICFYRGYNILDPQQEIQYQKCKTFAIDKPCTPANIEKT